MILSESDQDGLLIPPSTQAEGFHHVDLQQGVIPVKGRKKGHGYNLFPILFSP